MNSRHIEQIDKRTGEVLDGCMVWIPYRPKIKKGWFMAFQDSFEEIAKDPDMTGENYRVLFYLYSKLDFENFIQQTQKDIADGLGMRKEHVSRAMKLLTEKQIILEGPKTGRVKCYQLNPDYGWKGKVKNLEEYRKEQGRVALELIKGGRDIDKEVKDLISKACEKKRIKRFHVKHKNSVLRSHEGQKEKTERPD